MSEETMAGPAMEALREAIEFAEQDYHALTPAGEEMVDRWRAALQAGTGVAVKATTLQERVQPWMMACFGAEISRDRVERGDRLLEEVFELLQSGDYDPARVLALRDYVWGRDKGEPVQEVGGVMITLAAYCLAHGLDMHEAGETELARIWTKVDKIRAKQAAKPVGSALPIAPVQQAGVESECCRENSVGETCGPFADLENENVQLQQRIAEVERETDELEDQLHQWEREANSQKARAEAAEAALAASDAKLAEKDREIERLLNANIGSSM